MMRLASSVFSQTKFLFIQRSSKTIRAFTLAGLVAPGLSQSLPAQSFSDANWTSIGATGPVFAAVTDGLGALYIGGSFTTVGNVFATNVARWNGTSWSTLGCGVNNSVYALTVSGTDLYAGGAFTNAGCSDANHIAKWDGSNWSALDSGVNNSVYALASSGPDLYVGGSFFIAGG